MFDINILKNIRTIFQYIFVVFTMVFAYHQLSAETARNTPIIAQVDFDNSQTGSFSTLNIKDIINSGD